jgi:hypothetical protein
MRSKDAKARELRFELALAFGISACAVARLKSLVPGPAWQGSVL